MDDRTAYRIGADGLRELAKLKQLAVGANRAKMGSTHPGNLRDLEEYERLMQAAAVLDGKAQQGRLV